MLKTYIKLILFFFAGWGFILSPAYAIDIPAQLPNVFDPGQIQKNLQQDTLAPTTKALPAVANKLHPEAMIVGGETVHFELKKVIIKGNTVFSDEELYAIFASSLNKSITIAELEGLIQQITVKYRNAGYILSRAILPPQEIKNGTVKVDVIEGFIDTVTVSGDPGKSKKLIEAYGQQIVQCRPLNIAVMEREILLANDLPGITVKALIIPSKTTQDAADLILVTERKTISAALEHDNFGTRFLGPIQSSLALAANSIFAGGDTTGGNIVVTTRESELQYYNLYHTQPLNSKGLNFTIGSSYTATQPEFLLTPVEIVGMSASFYGNLTYNMIRSRERNLSFTAAANYQNVTSTILALPLYQDRVRSLSIGADYDTTDRWNGFDNMGINVIQGLPILGAQMHALQSRPKGRARYTRSTAYLTRQQPLYKALSLYTSFSGQYSFQPLLATEQFSVGGPVFGRGYGPSEIVGDRGLAGKVELRIDTQPAKRFLQTIEYYIFYDIGAIWNMDGFNLPARQDLTSTGVGLRCNFMPEVYGEVFIAKPLSLQNTTLTPPRQNPNQARAFFQIIARL